MCAETATAEEESQLDIKILLNKVIKGAEQVKTDCNLRTIYRRFEAKLENEYDVTIFR